MRYLTTIGFYAATIIGLCAAFPIRSVNLGERNAFFFGTLAFFSFGAVLAGCVCCRRRKKGFEEFRNESGSVESNKTEYPIFRALSPESQRSVSAANAVPAVNNSNENLIVEDIDNNNGPISPADLENIENNNAVDYIQNQNEIGVVIEPTSSYTRNRNLLESPELEPQQINDDLLQDVVISSTTEFFAHASSPQYTISSEPNITSNCSSNIVNCTNNLDINQPFNRKEEIFNDYKDATEEKIKTIVQENVPIDHKKFDLLTTTHLENSKPLTTIIEIESYPNEGIDCCAAAAAAALEEEICTNLPEESASIKSVSSDKSNEINSVEEALRVLDNAIEAEELSNICDDENDLPDEEFGDNTTNFQNVIRQLLINNGINGIQPNRTSDQVNNDIVNNKNENNDLESIRAEAENLVDSVLDECEILVEQRREALKNNSQNTMQVFSVTQCTFDYDKNINLEATSNTADISSNLDMQPKTDTNLPILSPVGSIEDFFTRDTLAQTSTPCIENKYFTLPDMIESKANNKYVQKILFDGVNNDDLVENSTEFLGNDFRPLNKTNSFENINDLAINGNNDKLIVNNETFELNKTLDLNGKEENQNEFTYPGDPCTSKQALERDYGLPMIKYDRDDVNSDELTTITPVNTPIELNYPNDTWDKITKSAGVCQSLNIDVKNYNNDDSENDTSKGGWFLHPQTNNDGNGNETFDVEDEANLELTFEALRKQLAEVLPQPQSVAGPQEYSDDEDDTQNRTFEEYRSPLDGLLGLLIDNDSSAPNPVQNEVFINYKRPLSPILEESEEETCKTFVLNETKCLDSTSTGCVDTGEAIMGVTKNLMASNDTLFNFEDTLGEKEDIFSPRIPSRSESQANTPVKSFKLTEDNSLGTSGSDTDKVARLQHSKSESAENLTPGRKSPPKTIEFIDATELKQDNDLCSPDQQKTFSEGTSSTTDRVSSDISPTTIDHDTTFTTNTIDDKSCITVIIKDDERISEISEPEWGSTASHGGYELNSLTDVPSIDFNVNNFDKDFERKFDVDIEQNGQILIFEDRESYHHENNESSTDNPPNDHERDSGHDDSGHSTQASIDEKSLTNELSAPSSFGGNEILMNQSTPSTLHINNLEITENCTQFLKNEIEISSSQNLKTRKEVPQHQQNQMLVEADIDGSKENTDPNVKVILSNSLESDMISYQKVQMNSQDTVIVDKPKNISSDLLEKDLSSRGVHENMFHQSDIKILPSKHQQTILNYSVSDVSGIQNEQNCLIVADEILGHLSGEEDPWAEPVNDIRYNGPCTDIISTSFGANEWDSDVDDSHSSEEFMYVRGTPTKEEEVQNSMIKSEDSDRQLSLTDGTYESNLWSSHEDKSPRCIKNSAEDDISEESSSEFEGEFVPSCWDSMATPARSALKSPDKSSSEEEIKSESKKRRSVAFKKQRYHSVYEYPRETAPLSPAYSDPYLWNKVSEASILNDKNEMEEFYDGFTVSSSMRPFHGSQFNALCHTWPTDSDFSWSQVEDLGSVIDNKQLATYTNIDIKWPQRAATEDEIDGNDIKIDDGKRPDSGVGISAEMLSERYSLGELRHTKSSLRLPLQQLPAIELSPTNIHPPAPGPPSPPPSPHPPPPPPPPPPTSNRPLLPLFQSQEHKIVSNQNDMFSSDTLILPTPSCTGSMDSLSSSSSSERQLSFTTFGKRNSFNENDQRNDIIIVKDQQLRPSIILIDSETITDGLKPDKIKQGDSTDEDSGIESIMKVNKESD